MNPNGESASAGRPTSDDTTAIHVQPPTSAGSDTPTGGGVDPQQADRVHAEDLGVHLDAVPRSTAVLVIKRGPMAGSKFTLEADVSRAGRSLDNEVFLDDITVSRHHAEIVRTAEGFKVRDAGSLNGTYVNRERVDDVALANGDELQIGKFKLVFFVGLAGG
ncbi:MAG: FHA domain-containing protein [Acidimicrobiales bacterium]